MTPQKTFAYVATLTTADYRNPSDTWQVTLKDALLDGLFLASLHQKKAGPYHHPCAFEVKATEGWSMRALFAEPSARILTRDQIIGQNDADPLAYCYKDSPTHQWKPIPQNTIIVTAESFRPRALVCQGQIITNPDAIMETIYMSPFRSLKERKATLEAIKTP